MIKENSSNRYILDADLEYPDELHELHNDYSLVPEKLEINHNMLSNYCSSIAYENCIKIGGVNKLVPNLGNKSKYVLHYKNLQLHLLLGMKLVSVHRIVKFRLFNNAKDYKKYVSKPSFASQKIFNKNVFAIHEIKPVLTLDKAISTGFSILDLSNFLMYEFHYKYIKTKYENIKTKYKNKNLQARTV